MGPRLKIARNIHGALIAPAPGGILQDRTGKYQDAPLLHGLLQVGLQHEEAEAHAALRLKVVDDGVAFSGAIGRILRGAVEAKHRLPIRCVPEPSEVGRLEPTLRLGATERRGPTKRHRAARSRRG